MRWNQTNGFSVTDPSAFIYLEIRGDDDVLKPSLFRLGLPLRGDSIMFWRVRTTWPLEHYLAFTTLYLPVVSIFFLAFILFRTKRTTPTDITTTTTTMPATIPPILSFGPISVHNPETLSYPFGQSVTHWCYWSTRYSYFWH